MKTDKAYGIAINQGGTADISDIRPWQRQMISARDFLLYFYFLFGGVGGGRESVQVILYILTM